MVRADVSMLSGSAVMQGLSGIDPKLGAHDVV
jgi:hypothetical protein